MAITFNADEIFEMAEEMERNGAMFYREAAEKASDKKIKQLFLDMAVMEDSHLWTFKQMREELSDPQEQQGVFEPDDEAVLYLRAMADAQGTEGKKSRSEKLTGNETTEEVLRIAVTAEKESVVFYSGLKNAMSNPSGKDKVDAIIKEELRHITSLVEHLSALK